MGSILKSLFGKSEPASVAKPAVEKPAPKSVENQRRLRVVFCGPIELREISSASQKFEFVPYGNVDRELLKSINQAHIDAALLYFDPAKDAMESYAEAATQIFAGKPCFFLCDQAAPVKNSPDSWRIISVKDLKSISEIEDKLRRAMLLFPAMKKESLRRALALLKTIPAEAGSHQRIVKELQNPDFVLEDIVALIKKDPSLTAQLLKIVNSAAFLRGSPVQYVDEAVSILGVSKLQALISSAWAFFLIDDHACEGFHPKSEWSHAVQIAERVRAICEEASVHGGEAETAIIAGMLHDLGKLLLAANMGKDYAGVIKVSEKDNLPLWQVENSMLGYNHAEVGGCVLGGWGVPIPVVEGVLNHHVENPPEHSAAYYIQKAQVKTAPAAA